MTTNDDQEARAILDERAFGLYRVLADFFERAVADQLPDHGRDIICAEPVGPRAGETVMRVPRDDRVEDSCLRIVPEGLYGDTDDTGCYSLANVAIVIDELYASDESAPPLWQDQRGRRSALRRRVKELLKPLSVEGWRKKIPGAIEQYAVRHYSKR